MRVPDEQLIQAEVPCPIQYASSRLLFNDFIFSQPQIGRRNREANHVCLGETEAEALSW